MLQLPRRLLALCAALALFALVGCGSGSATKGGPPEGYQGSKSGPPAGLQGGSTNTPAKP